MAETILKKKTVKLWSCVKIRKQEMEKTATLRLTDQFAIKKKKRQKHVLTRIILSEN